MKSNLLFKQAAKALFLVFAINLATFSTAIAQAPTPYADWRFDDASDLTKASTGYIDLVASGTNFSAVDGPYAEDGAVRIGLGSHYIFTHGLAPANGESYINEYSILCDFKASSIGSYYTFFQANGANTDDGELFIKNSDGTIGVRATGYSTTPIVVDTWHRMIVSVKNGSEFSIYLDATKILTGNVQAIDSRFGLRETILLFGDNDGDDATFDVARTSFYDTALTQEDVTKIGQIQPPTALEDVELKDVNIVTSQKTITINNDSDCATVTIYNLNGTQINQFKANSGSKSVTLDKAGLYLVTVQKQGKIKTQKVLLTEI